jgi:2-polyprenyl-3-methyl-5-hydroxy-6-metoxy-1,4-benzoquinol methylase
MSNQKQCYLCGKTEFKQRPGNVRDNSELKIYECTSCGLVFLSSFDHIQQGFYEKSAMHDGEPLDVEIWLNETERDDTRRFQYLKSLLPNRTLLDFGCGAGGFLLKARKLCKMVAGVEPETRLGNHFQSQRLSVFSHLSKIPQRQDGQGYDIITLFHVLEHLPEPKATLIELSKILAKDGQIVIEVPNADDALLTLYNNEPFSHFTYWSCHLFLFTTKTLEMLISQIGLKVNYIRQLQRYPLSNHLYWLSKGKPGGHQHWHFLDSPEIHAAYEKHLAAIGKCDTIIASISKQQNT